MSKAPTKLPSRFRKPSLLQFFSTIFVVYMIVASFQGAEISFEKVRSGIPYLMSMLQDMLPPDTSNLKKIVQLLFTTFQMAIAGTLLGVCAAFPLSVLASRRHSPHISVYFLTRSILSFIRSVPDLIWALVFVISVGLGAFAGTLALMIDTMAFCGRFFAEALEETPKEPEEALQAIGAGRLGTLFCATLPSVLPALINTALYSLEKATRASIVLGLVGAGGIGMELKSAMDLLYYDQAATIIMCIFVLVMCVEQASSYVRKKIMGES